MKALFSGIAALGITAAATSVDAQNLSNLNDIGDMATGVYQINDADDNRCYLAIGNYSWAKAAAVMPR